MQIDSNLGNRCPCFGEGRACGGCGCKNCSNPLNVTLKTTQGFEDFENSGSTLVALESPRFVI